MTFNYVHMYKKTRTELAICRMRIVRIALCMHSAHGKGTNS